MFNIIEDILLFGLGISMDVLNFISVVLNFDLSRKSTIGAIIGDLSQISKKKFDEFTEDEDAEDEDAEDEDAQDEDAQDEDAQDEDAQDDHEDYYRGLHLRKSIDMKKSNDYLRNLMTRGI
jgi:ABC-type Zn2+ transport system substrate-binding protein/surface adhesin